MFAHGNEVVLVDFTNILYSYITSPDPLPPQFGDSWGIKCPSYQNNYGCNCF